jgi:hypothetical protein
MINPTVAERWVFIVGVTVVYLLARYVFWRPQRAVEAWFPLWTGRGAVLGLSLALLYSLVNDQLANFPEGVNTAVLVFAIGGGGYALHVLFQSDDEAD